ncbi:MAG: hypothetical protein ACRDF4_12360 [Rhabdochlamydiaceae bacterium]
MLSLNGQEYAKEEYLKRLSKLTDLELIKEMQSKTDDLVFFETQTNLLWKTSEITRQRKIALDIELLDLRNTAYAVKAEISTRDKFMERAAIKLRTRRCAAETIGIERPKKSLKE